MICNKISFEVFYSVQFPTTIIFFWKVHIYLIWFIYHFLKFIVLHWTFKLRKILCFCKPVIVDGIVVIESVSSKCHYIINPNNSQDNFLFFNIHFIRAFYYKVVHVFFSHRWFKNFSIWLICFICNLKNSIQVGPKKVHHF